MGRRQNRALGRGGLNYSVFLDPGGTVGWAVYLGKTLVEAGTWKRGLKKPVPAPWLHYLSEPSCLLVTEIPILYDSAEERNPNSILRNGVLGGRLMGWGDAAGAQVEELSPPSKWKGTATPKPPPGQVYILEYRMLKRLSKEELAPLPKVNRKRIGGSVYDHNMVDAICMGLWWFERL